MCQVIAKTTNAKSQKTHEISGLGEFPPNASEGIIAGCPRFAFDGAESERLFENWRALTL